MLQAAARIHAESARVLEHNFRLVRQDVDLEEEPHRIQALAPEQVQEVVRAQAQGRGRAPALALALRMTATMPPTQTQTQMTIREVIRQTLVEVVPVPVPVQERGQDQETRVMGMLEDVSIKVHRIRLDLPSSNNRFKLLP